MKKIIATYFYQHDKADTYEYGNINLDPIEHEAAYWNTIYVFYKTSLLFNTDGYEHAFFTNKKDFVLRNTLIALGVKIYDDVGITFMNEKKWAAVKYIFDVLRYINESEYYSGTEKFVLLDTDILFISDLEGLFKQVSDNNILCYEFDMVNDENKVFHGLSIDKLKRTTEILLHKPVIIRRLVGGEFLAFEHSSLTGFLLTLDEILNDKTHKIFTTEEQILTVMRGAGFLSPVNNVIFRVWTSLRYVKLPTSFDHLALLHLPSEKETGLKMLASKLGAFSEISGSALRTKQDFIDILKLNNPIKLYVRICTGYLKKKYFFIRRRICFIWETWV